MISTQGLMRVGKLEWPLPFRFKERSSFATSKMDILTFTVHWDIQKYMHIVVLKTNEIKKTCVSYWFKFLNKNNLEKHWQLSPNMPPSVPMT